MTKSDFNCKQCGNCCACVLMVSQKEINRIKNYINKYHIQPTNRNNILNDEFVDICPFLDEKNNCKIYEVRPEICRWFRCDINKDSIPLNHMNKKIINMLKEFYPHSYCPDIDKEIENLNKDYTKVKKTINRSFK